MNLTLVIVSRPVSSPYRILVEDWLAALAKFLFCNPTFRAMPNKFPVMALWLRLPSRLVEKEYFLAGDKRMLRSTVSSFFRQFCSMATNLHAPSELNRFNVFK